MLCSSSNVVPKAISCASFLKMISSGLILNRLLVATGGPEKFAKSYYLYESGQAVCNLYPHKYPQSSADIRFPARARTYQRCARVIFCWRRRMPRRMPRCDLLTARPSSRGWLKYQDIGD